MSEYRSFLILKWFTGTEQIIKFSPRASYSPPKGGTLAASPHIPNFSIVRLGKTSHSRNPKKLRLSTEKNNKWSGSTFLALSICFFTSPGGYFSFRNALQRSCRWLSLSVGSEQIRLYRRAWLYTIDWEMCLGWKHEGKCSGQWVSNIGWWKFVHYLIVL